MSNSDLDGLDRRELGQAGEDLAVRHLQRHGRKVLRRNFRAPKGGEVDIVCRHGDTLVFAEVKTRRGKGDGRPADSVTRDKEFLIARGALEWLRLLGNPPGILFRFDIVEVIVEDGRAPEIEVLENAFELPEPFIY